MGRGLRRADAGQEVAPALPRPTQDRLLDAAEDLFSRSGFDAVSTREICRQANVNLALLSYHFGGKEALFEQVIARRAEEVGRKRRERLRALQAVGELSVEALLDAFMRPLIERMRSGDPGWQRYVRLLPQLGLANRWLGLMERHFDDTARLFIRALQQALPGLEAGLLHRGFHMVLISMLAVASGNRRVDTLSDGRQPAADLDAAYDALLAFAAAGLRGLAGGDLAGGTQGGAQPASREPSAG
ncbi:TetR family transcriptional regulator [Roseomonas sp. NAR14]|uniref:TetR family transcriptional regulator n=1 Tax=Roseomonas acroporae TaxID=2937791 RepID=A0A9X1YES2_9PROT|nr:TetR/AcrR family transcriptional regulator [Roseomonas acroporae]MCK8787673.1 TetR family transcriptional regulator [Roseomonas acroporae]